MMVLRLSRQGARIFLKMFEHDGFVVLASEIWRVQPPEASVHPHHQPTISRVCLHRGLEAIGGISRQFAPQELLILGQIAKLQRRQTLRAKNPPYISKPQ